METIKEPDIKFCINGHIFDASLNEECPYCKKVSKNAERLNSILEKEEIRIAGYGPNSEESDETEMLMEPEDDSEETEMLMEPEDDSEETEMLMEPEDDSEETEMLMEPEDDSEETEMLLPDEPQQQDVTIGEKEGYVQGWLVCISGKEKGRGYTLASFNKILWSNDTEQPDNDSVDVVHERAPMESNPAEYEIIRNRNGEFSLSNISSNDFLVDGIRFTRSKKLYPYAHIVMMNREYVFVPFAGNQFDWED